MTEQNVQAVTTKGANEKYCVECGATINAKAEICPKCGVRQSAAPSNSNVIINLPQKSMLLGLILTFFFGPLGMLYATVLGGIVMFIVCVLTFGITIMTLGVGSVLFFLVWIIQMLWAGFAIAGYNKRVLNPVTIRTNS